MTHVVAADIRTQKILKRKKIEFSTLEDFVNHEDFLSYEKKALAFMHELNQKHPDIDHKHKNISLWEMSKSDTYYAFMKEIIINCESILSTLQNINPSKLVVLDTSSRLGKIQKYCSQHIKIIVHDSTISRIKSFILKKGMPLALKTIHTKFLSVLKKGTYKPEKSKKVVFFDVKRGFIFSEPFLKKMAKDVTVLQKKIYKVDNSAFQTQSIYQYITPKSKRTVYGSIILLRKKHQNLLKSSQFRKYFKYKKIPLYAIAEEMYSYLFHVGYPESVFELECLDNFLEHSNPSLLFNLCEDPKDRKAILQLRKRYNIPAIMMIHGIISNRGTLHNLTSDKIIVFGDYFKRIMESMGNNKEKIVVTGNPAWDYLIGKKLNMSVLGKLGLPNKPIILLATTNMTWESRNKLGHVTIQAMKSFPEYHLVIKVHPEEDTKLYKDLLANHRLSATIVEQGSYLHSLIQLAELVIITSSTVGLETVLLDTPLIDVNLTNGPHHYDYVEKGVALSVQKEDKMVLAIKSILQDTNVKKALAEKRKKYIFSHAYKQDGKATQRVVKVIQDMLQNKR